MKHVLTILICFLSFVALAKDTAGPTEKFGNAEASFKNAMETLLAQYIDKGLKREDLYEAATAGMLSSLNEDQVSWNKLLSPRDLKDLHEEMSGKVSGIGINMKFDATTGYAQVLNVIPGTPAARAGILADDQVLSVNGTRYKGKEFRNLVATVRGEAGETVALKILRGDAILEMKLKRQAVTWDSVKYEKTKDGVALLTIDFFNEDTPRLVSQVIQEMNRLKIKKLVIDVRENSGGGFDQAIKTASLFLPKGAVIVSTRDRNGNIERKESGGGSLNGGVQIVLLADRHTSCGAELFVSALRENKNLKLVGEKTFGKWNVQKIETLPNRFAIKYTIQEFLSPLGNSYQGIGIQPDMPVSRPENLEVGEIRAKHSFEKRLAIDSQLKSAIELARTM